MKKNGLTLLSFSFLFLFATILNAQSWSAVQSETAHALQQYSDGHYQQVDGKIFKIQTGQFLSRVQSGSALNENINLELPLPDGKIISVDLKVNRLMSKGLQEKFPMIRSWTGDYNGTPVYVDYGVNGLHAMVFFNDNPVYIDPLEVKEGLYISYEADKFQSSKQRMECGYDSDLHLPKGININESKEQDNTVLSSKAARESISVMKTFRLALACTGEYARFYGGTVEGALSGMVTTMNRVNAIYRRDVGVQMELVPNNDEIIYLDANTDPYSNNSSNSLLRENQTNLDNVIGTENYDIGHVFSTGGGGVAYLESVCNRRNKARGVTGSSRPQGDPYDIDYVAHEMGHQFGANHSFNNSCGGNREDATAFEPGSGNSIMGYAGICAPNIQNNSNALFHGGNLIEINNFLNRLTCQEEEEYNNSAPELVLASNYIQVPAKTPFYLDVTAIDAEGDNLTYTWEQYDTEIVSQPPDGSAANGPLFRGFLPDENPVRYIPSLSALATNRNPTWEQLPKRSRMINMGVTVRDNHPDAPRVSQEFIQIEVIDVGDGFRITHPTSLHYVHEGSYLDLQWNPANLQEAPFFVNSVDIFLLNNSTFEVVDTIAIDVPNDGLYDFPFNYSQETAYRVMIKTHQRNYFDLSSTIVSRDRMDVFVLPGDYEYCPGSSDTLGLYILGRYDQAVEVSLENVPAGLEYELFPQETYGRDTVYIVFNDNGNQLPPEDFSFQALFTVNNKTETLTIDYKIGPGVPYAPEMSFNTLSDSQFNIEWEDADENESYRIQYSGDENFTSIIFDTIVNTASARKFNAEFIRNYFRYRTENSCSTSDWVVEMYEADCSVNNLLSDYNVDGGFWEENTVAPIDLIRRDNGKYAAYMGTQSGHNVSEISGKLDLQGMQNAILKIPYTILGNDVDCEGIISFEVYNGQNLIASKVIPQCLPAGAEGEVLLSFNCGDPDEDIVVKISADVNKSSRFFFKLLAMDLTGCIEACDFPSEPTAVLVKSAYSTFCTINNENTFQYLTSVYDSLLIGINPTVQLGTVGVGVKNAYYDDVYASANGDRVAILARSYDIDNIDDCIDPGSYTARLFFTEEEFTEMMASNSEVNGPGDLGVSFIAENGKILNKKNKELLPVTVPAIGNLASGIIALDVEVQELNGTLIIHALGEKLADVWYDLRAVEVDTFVDLRWELKTNEDLEYMILERSTDNINFTGIDTITIAWNQTYPAEFTYVDYDIENKQTYYYRNKVEDKEGNVYYSPVIVVDVNYSSITNFVEAEMQLFPNPHNDYVIFRHPQTADYRVEIYDALGRLMESLEYKEREYRYMSSELQSGIFYMKLYQSGKFAGVKSFIKM